MPDENELQSLPVDEVVARVGVAKAIGIKHVASLLFTYRCTIACKHCLFSCSPNQPNVCASLADGVEFLRQLRATDRVIHIAGGEAMMYYDQMLAICCAAHAEGAAPHFIETNASWCANDDLARRRYKELRAVGVKGIYISADPFHQVFVSPERRLRAFQFAVEAFGRENVAAADLTIEQLHDLRAVGNDEARLADHVRQHPPRFVGRAGEALARFEKDRPLEELVNDGLWHGDTAGSVHCHSEFDPAEMWEIHIDPYGNIQTCCGIVVGNARATPLPVLMQRGFDADNELVRMAMERGPFGYLELAKQHGYQPLAGYKQKCHLCWETRKFLRTFYPKTFGPAEIYGNGTE